MVQTVLGREHLLRRQHFLHHFGPLPVWRNRNLGAFTYPLFLAHMLHRVARPNWRFEMRHVRILLSATLLLLPMGAHAQGLINCFLTVKAAPPNAPAFSRYPAALWKGKLAPVSQSSRLARKYRTIMRSTQTQGPDFAGHLSIALWGCGTACTGWAAIDAGTGRVISLPHSSPIRGNHNLDDDKVFYQKESRLLILEGALGDEEVNEGLTYLLWTGHGFRKLAFYPRASICRPSE